MPDIFLPPFFLPRPSFCTLVSAILKQIYPCPSPSFILLGFPPWLPSRLDCLCLYYCIPIFMNCEKNCLLHELLCVILKWTLGGFFYTDRQCMDPRVATGEFVKSLW